MNREEAQEVMEEWAARVGSISDSARAAWKRILESDNIRGVDTALEVVKELAEAKDSGQYKRNPGLSHFEQAYRNALVRRERERYESDQPNGCDTCRRSGLMAVVMAYSITRDRYCPVRPNQVPYCKGEAYRQYVPCTCEKGQIINMAGPNYSRDVLRRINQHFVWVSNYAADAHVIACRNKQAPEQED